MERKVRAQTESLVFVFGTIAALVLINLLAMKVPKRWDLTERQLYTLSDGTKHVLSRLQDELVITVYFTPDQPSPFNTDERTLRDLLDEYRISRSDKVVLKFVSADTDEKSVNGAAAKLAGCTLSEVQGLKDEQATKQQAFRCVTFHYRDQDEKIAFLRPGAQGLEFEISSLVKQMLTPLKDREPKIGLLQGHGELSNTTDLQYLDIPRLREQLQLRYKLVPVDLEKGNKDVPMDEIHGLIIANPTQRIEEKELRKLDAYLMKGGSIAIFAGGLNVTAVEMGSASASKSEHNLNAWLQGYGLLLNNDVVLDPRSGDGTLESPNGAVRVKYITWPQIMAFKGKPSQDELKSNGGLDPDFPAVFRMTQFQVPYASSITYDENKAKSFGGTLRVFGRTSRRSIARSENYERLNIVDVLREGRQLFDNAKQHGPYAVGLAYEGKFQSAFKGRAAPPEPGLAVTPVPDQATAPARLMIISSGQTITANTIQEQFNSLRAVPNLGLLINTFDYLSQDTELLAVRAKDSSEPPLEGDLSTFQRESFRWSVIAGVPLLIGVLGLLINWRRRQRRSGYAALYGTPQVKS